LYCKSIKKELVQTREEGKEGKYVEKCLGIIRIVEGIGNGSYCTVVSNNFSNVSCDVQRSRHKVPALKLIRIHKCFYANKYYNEAAKIGGSTFGKVDD
jgi:hypothetical protein